jgi:hypothetical protein
MNQAAGTVSALTSLMDAIPCGNDATTPTASKYVICAYSRVRDFDCTQHLVAGVCQSDSIRGTAPG